MLSVIKASRHAFLCMFVLTTTTRATTCSAECLAAFVFQKFSYFFQQAAERRRRFHHLLQQPQHRWTPPVIIRESGSRRRFAAAVRCGVLDRSSSISRCIMSTAAAAAAASGDDSILTSSVSSSSSSSPLASPSSPHTASLSVSSNSIKQHQEEEMRRLVVVLAGPTAVGKSRVAAQLCANLQQQQQQQSHHSGSAASGGGAMIVSADSVQAYRGVDIGANKPTLAERAETPHLLLDMIDAADQKYNAAEWTRDALYAIRKLLLVPHNNDDDNDSIDQNNNENEEALDDSVTTKQQRQSSIDSAIQQAKLLKSIPLDNTPVVPVVVGGTMMYLTWLVHGRPDALRPSDSAMQRAATEIQKYHQQKSSAANAVDNHDDDDDKKDDWEGAVRAVAALGATFAQQAQKLSGNDWYRLRRILEVAYTSMEQDNKDDDEDKQQQQQQQDGKIELNDENDDDDANKVAPRLYSGEREGGLLALSSSSSSSYDVRCFFLCPDDRMQHSKVIDERCEQMLLRGLIAETANLWLSGQLPDMACKAIGYRQTLDYLLQGPTSRADCKNNEVDKKTAFHAYLQDFCTATRRYSKKQMQWFRKDEEFVFVPISLLNTTEATDHASKEIQRMLNLPRPDFDKERLDPAGVSAETRRRNEAQGTKMKVYQHKPRLLHKDSKELEAILQQANECINRVQAKKKPRR